MSLCYRSILLPRNPLPVRVSLQAEQSQVEIKNLYRHEGHEKPVHIEIGMEEGNKRGRKRGSIHIWASSDTR